MADQELNPTAGGVDESGQIPPLTTPTQDERQPAQSPSAQDKAGTWDGNLDDLPQFRKVKSEYDKSAAQLRKELESVQRQRQADQQRAYQMEQMLEQMQTQSMDEPQRAQFEVQKLQRMNQALMQQMQELQRDTVKNRALTLMQQKAAARGVTVTLEELSEQPDADTAWDFVLEKGFQQWKQGGAQQQERQQKQEANTPYLGGGNGGSSVQTDLQSRYDKALKKFNGGEMLVVMQEAVNQGIELKV